MTRAVFTPRFSLLEAIIRSLRTGWQDIVTPSRKKGFRFHPTAFFFIDLEVTSPRRKKELLLEYLYDHPETDGLFCVNQEITRHISSLLTTCRMWDRYEIAAFDYPGDPRISYIEQDIPKIAQTCIQELISSILSGRKDKHIVVPSRFHPA